MLKNKQPMPVTIRASMQQQQQLASARNRRLAQQMENRPSVQAALKLKQVRESGLCQSARAVRTCRMMTRWLRAKAETSLEEREVQAIPILAGTDK